MAISVIREKESETIQSLDVPYYVHDPDILPGTEMSRLEAVMAAGAQGVTDQETEADDYQFDRLAYNVARVVLRYRQATLSPLTPPSSGEGSIEFGFNGLAFQPEHRLISLGNVFSEEDAPDFDGYVNVGENSEGKSEIGGYDLTLPAETDYVNYVLPNASFTSAYRAVVSALLFKVHGAPVIGDTDPADFFGYAPGEVMLVRAQARIRTDDDLQLSFGFSVIPNDYRQVGNYNTETDVGDPLVVDGHDLVWAFSRDKKVTVDPAGANISFVAPKIKFIYVERIWKRADLNYLALPGS